MIEIYTSLPLRVTRAAKSFPQGHRTHNRALMATGGDGDVKVAIIAASSGVSAATSKGKCVARTSATEKGKGTARESTSGVLIDGRSTSTTMDTSIEVVYQNGKEA